MQLFLSLSFTKAAKYVENHSAAILLEELAVPEILDEIKEDLKDEKYAQLWEKYGSYVIAAVLGIIVATSGSVWWKSHSLAKYEAAGSTIYEIIMTDEKLMDFKKAINKYSSVIEKDSPEYSAIAGLRKAAISIKDGKAEDALKVYIQVTENSNAPIEMRELASLLYIYNSKNANEDVDKQLEEVSKNDSIFKYSALEILAVNKISEGNKKAAKEALELIINDSKAPLNIVERSREMLSIIDGRV